MPIIKISNPDHLKISVWDDSNQSQLCGVLACPDVKLGPNEEFEFEVTTCRNRGQAKGAKNNPFRLERDQAGNWVVEIKVGQKSDERP